MTDRPMNERALTEEEKTDFLRDLGSLCLEYGVDFDVEETSYGYQGTTSRLAINDATGVTLFDCCSFDQSDARYHTGQ